MSNRERAHNHTIRGAESRHRYNESKRIRRLENKKNNKFSDIDTFKGTSLPMSINDLSPQGQNSTTNGTQIRISLDDTMPCLPQPQEFKDVDKVGISIGIQPVIQTAGDSPVEPIPHGSSVATQAFGRGPNDGKTNKLRAISAGSPRAPMVLSGAGTAAISSLNFGGGSSIPSTDYRSRNSPREPTPAQRRAANSLGVEYQVIQAIEAVESGGRPAAVRFEPHLWHRKYREFGLTGAQRDQMPFTPNAQVPFSKVASETNEAAFDKAMAINPALAVYSTSFGLYQVMGYNFADYKNTATEKVKSFRDDPEGASYELLLKWFEGNPSAIQAAKDKDFMLLAKHYNGPANVNVYGPRMAKEYEAFSGGSATA